MRSRTELSQFLRIFPTDSFSLISLFLHSTLEDGSIAILFQRSVKPKPADQLVTISRSVL